MHKLLLKHYPDNKNGRFMEFHISDKARKKYNFNEELFSITGNVVFSNIYAARVFAEKINSKTNMGVKSSDIFAMGLIHEILHFVINEHKSNKHPNIFREISEDLKSKIGDQEFSKILLTFITEFPGSAIFKKIETPEGLLNRVNDEGISFKEIIVEEILLLHITNTNPALDQFKELFDETPLIENSKYEKLIDSCKKIVSTVPALTNEESSCEESLYELLIAPSLAHPNSISEQLQFMINKWGILISKFNITMLNAVDSIKEENKPGNFPFSGPAETFVQTYNENKEDIENFTTDKIWMPNVKLIAKSTMVWLDQLSKKYKKDIKTLDKIPDEELDILSSSGFNGLWLIGLWNRSEASKKIKQKCGNPDAEASAYSLYNYDINQGLGGWEGIQVLREKCLERGIRLASDMVPNHTGIDSEWVRSKPDYFIQTDHPPFPSYTFNNENLSDDPNIGIYLEDHYYTKDDASVVFKRVDFNSGDTRYIYHGNDGTMMPWNDTAQINFLSAEVREAVIQDILHVAKNFPIIRFDAAMTLAKKHIQRLWYPKPGTGGDIASRSDYSISQEEFERLMPVEFWREVVDRIAIEAPDTLLLAEAFWMLESYFVRTLGMHRVYNSAFMNMLKNEENQKYRESIINTIVFDPDILKRYVNFMNNPDEDTAFEQFGSGDKYFGVCTLMVTLPGLPMFGHGQIEGYKEKYGMEYSKAYWNEDVDQCLVNGHKHLIFPLMRRRELFSEVENFNIYPFIKENNITDDNVFVYTNRYKNERSLVIYNNKFQDTQGWVKHSEQKLVKNSNNRYTESTELSKSLGIHFDGDYFTIFTNQRDGLTYIRSSKEICEKGMFFSLKAYESQVFLDIYEVKDTKEGYYAKLNHELQGHGIKDINMSVRIVSLGSIYSRTRDFFTKKEIEIKDLKDYLKFINEEPLFKKLSDTLRLKNPVIYKATLIYEITESKKIDIISEWLFNNFLEELDDVKLIIYLKNHKQLTFHQLLQVDIVKKYLGHNIYNNQEWFNGESYSKAVIYINKICGSKILKLKDSKLFLKESKYMYDKLLKLTKPSLKNS